MFGITKQHYSVVIAGLFVVGLFVTQIMKWTTLGNTTFYLIESGFILTMYFTWFQTHRNVKFHEAWNIAKPALEAVGVTSMQGAELDWMFLRKENGEYSEEGKVWDIQGKGGPRRAAIFVNRASGEVMGIDTTAGDREPPTQFEPKFFILPSKKGRREVRIKEDTTG